jgi:hypothetical protein
MTVALQHLAAAVVFVASAFNGAAKSSNGRVQICVENG